MLNAFIWGLIATSSLILGGLIGSYLSLGKRTLGYHSSFGCRFTCWFCAVVPIYNARWKGKSAAGIADDVLKLKVSHGIDAVEFHDNNFFTSRKRVVEFAKLMQGQNISWCFNS